MWFLISLVKNNINMLSKNLSFQREKVIIGDWIQKLLHYLLMTKHQSITKKFLCLKYFTSIVHWFPELLVIF